MGSDASSSSNSTSTENTDSQNETVTASLTGSSDLGFSTGNISGSLQGLSYAYDTNNPTTNNNTYNTQTYQLGANDSNSTTPSSSSATTPSALPSNSNIDWGEVIVYIIGGVLLVLVLRLIGDKNA